MTVYDEHFEATRLAMLAEQHQNIVTTTGEVVFRADDDEDRLSGTSWTFVVNIFDLIDESGFKHHLIGLLDQFIEYRGQCKKLPVKEGIVRFGGGQITIEWLPNGSTHL